MGPKTLISKSLRTIREKQIIAIAIAATVVISGAFVGINQNIKKQTLNAEKQQQTEGIGKTSDGTASLPTSSTQGTTSDVEIARTINTNGGDANCRLARPHDAPQTSTEDIFSTLLVAYPGSGKRTAFQQLEGMTELRAADDHALTPDAKEKRFAFMKTNYPQHEGTWGFDDMVDQSILLVRNPRWALVSYQHLLYEIDYSTDWEESYSKRYFAYTRRPPVDDWLLWRALRFDVEIQKWGWFIDYWMEGGVFRDLFSNELTNTAHFNRLTQPVMYAQAELINAQKELNITEPIIDPHCKTDLQNCKPVAIASFEKIIDVSTGPVEIGRFVAAIQGKPGIPNIDKEANECVWRELIINGKKYTNTLQDRGGKGKGPAMAEFTFTLKQMNTIQAELGRLKTKYSGKEWEDDSVAEALVGYIDGYIRDNADEISKM
jgi:hypothetical protein